MEVSINFSDVYFSLYDKSVLIEEIQISLALMLFKQGKISITKAAVIANKDIYEFMKECSKNEIPVINITPDEFEKEWESLKREFL